MYAHHITVLPFTGAKKCIFIYPLYFFRMKGVGGGFPFPEPKEEGFCQLPSRLLCRHNSAAEHPRQAEAREAALDK